MAFKTQRQKRYERLRYYGFLPFEAYELSRYRHTTTRYYRMMLSDRRRLLRRAHVLDLNKYQFRNWIYNLYYMFDRDPWKILKDARQKAIESGDYIPKKKRKYRDSMGHRIGKGKVQEQKERWIKKHKGQR